jgi:tRNA-dihydrouridine synthase B
MDVAPEIVGNRYLHPLTIGRLRLANNLCLAPMAGFTNVAFRLIAKEVGGCGLVATEMVAALGNPGAQNVDRFRILTQNVPQEKPLAMQVYGRDPELCGLTARALDLAGADIVDLNCGCPVKKAKQSGCGVALMKEPEQVGRVIRAMRDAVSPDKPVTIKMRLGYNAENRNQLEVAQAAVENGAAAVFVHARTGESKHGVPVDLSGVREVKDLMQRMGRADVPVIANGSLETALAIRAAKDEGHADGYQIGRAACGDPWLFRNLIADLTGGERYNPTYDERRALLVRHFDLILELFGEERGVRVMRKYTFFYCNGLPGVRKFRDRFMRIESRAAFHQLVDDFFNHLRGADAHELGEAEHLTLFDRGEAAGAGEE